MKALDADDPRAIGEYRLQAQLGVGGMGRVYLGLSPAGRAVAIKVVRPDLAMDTGFLRRFGQEVAAARAVSGIYTAPVVASGLDERPPWLATAFVPGPSLDQVVTEHGPLPEAALWPLLAGLVEALQAIHACGVVHRDLKPANVLLATDGPRVIDFGISRAADGTALTATGVVFGTPGYMSPEQAEGRLAGPASDVFALGCVIAYAATGSGAFGSGTAAAVLYRVVHAEAVLDGVPPQLREIVSGCLAKDPAARPEPRALAAAIAGRDSGTGPSVVTFWPGSVASVIGAYQARLEQETREAGRPGEQPYWPTISHPPTTLSSPGNRLGVQGAHGAQAAQWAQASGGNGGSRSGWPSQPPPGYGPTQGYPQPRGYGTYGGGQASQAPASGYLPGAGPPAYPQPYQPPARARLVPVPPSVLKAVTLMYAGAAFVLVYALGVIIVAASIIRSHPLAAAAQTGSRHPLAGVAFLTILASLVEIGLWLGIARACRNGKNWARVTGTALFGVHTLGFLAVLANSHPGLGLTKLLTLVSWLISLGAVVFLWQRPSSVFFKAG